jgi:translocator protein
MSAPAASQVWLALAALVALCLAVAVVGAGFTRTSLGDWYPALRKPSWNPPGWLFGPVWTVLYLAMALAAWLVWRQAGVAGAALGLGLFALQLALNLAWSGIFFAWRRPGWAAIEIALLWTAILATLVVFARTSGVAALLLLPYLAWVSFAAVLNVTIWQLNRA